MNTCRKGMGKLVAMDKFSEEDRLLCVELVIKNGDSATLARREFCKIRGLKNDRKCPSLPLIRYWVKKFKETGSAKRQEVPPREKTARTPEKIDAAANILRENNRISTRRLVTAIGTSHVTAWKICKKDLQMIPYKLQITQALSENDPQQRIKFCQDMLETFTGFKNIIFSDEAHFHLDGVVNKQNCRFWAVENPRETISRSLHPKKVTV